MPALELTSGCRLSRGLLRPRNSPHRHAIPTHLPTHKVALFRHPTRMVSNHPHTQRPLVLLRDHVLHRQLQLLWIERHQSRERHNEKHGRYLSYDWDLDRQSRSWVGTTGLAVFVTSGTWFRAACVSLLAA